MAYSDHGYGRPSLRAGGATLRGVVPYPPAWKPYGLEARAESSRKPGVLGRWTLRRTIQVWFGANPAARLPGGTTIFVVPPRQFSKHPG